MLAPSASEIHAYDVSEALPYVKDGAVLSSYQAQIDMVTSAQLAPRDPDYAHD